MLRTSIGEYDSVDQLPLILKLNVAGEPLEWITYRESAFYYAKDKVKWSMGEHHVTLRGGINAKTGERSTLKMDTIIFVDSKESPSKYRRPTPQLSNRTLFERDRRLCAYCGNKFSLSQLTRDHVLPTSKGGKNVWANVVTSCGKCNRLKDDRTPEQASMPLLYVPYAPSHYEKMILDNRRILADQMEYLLKSVPKSSRLHQDFADYYQSH